MYARKNTAKPTMTAALPTAPVPSLLSNPTKLALYVLAYPGVTLFSTCPLAIDATLFEYPLKEEVTGLPLSSPSVPRISLPVSKSL